VGRDEARVTTRASSFEELGADLSMNFYWLILGVLAVWRITHLLTSEDGPWDLLIHLRSLFGRGGFGRLMDCFYCLSLWVSLPFTFVIGASWKEYLLLWPALSAGAILVERLSNRNLSYSGGDVGPPAYFEDPEKDDVLRTR
jgi:hypothetical protein